MTTCEASTPRSSTCWPSGHVTPAGFRPDAAGRRTAAPRRMPRAATPTRRLLRSVEVGGELLDPTADLIPGGADFSDRPSGRVGQLPVDVALPWDVGTFVAAPHRHDDVGPLGELARQTLRPASGEVHAELPHHLDDIRLDPVGRCGAGRRRGVSAAGRSFE